MASSLKRNK